MTAGLYSYFQSKPLDSSEFTEYSASYHHLISLQESIGWGHFLGGKIRVRVIYQSRREAKRNSVTNMHLLPTYFHPIPSHRSYRNQNTRPIPSAQPPLRPTRISDHYNHIPSCPSTIQRTILQNQILIRHFQQLPLTFPDAPT
jgi:hypothetical protein